MDILLIILIVIGAIALREAFVADSGKSVKTDGVKQFVFLSILGPLNPDSRFRRMR